MEPELHQKPVRFYEIDLLRFAAAIAVVLYHLTFAGFYNGVSPIKFSFLSELCKYGFLGVELFFMISGYVVLMSSQGKSLSVFFTSRVTRLYPAYWVACTICFVVVRLFSLPIIQNEKLVLDSSIGHYVVNMTMLQSFFGIPNLDGVYWTLSYEILFYFLISLIISFGWMKHIYLVICVWVVYCIIASLAFNTGFFALLLFPKYAPYFIAGMVLFLIQTSQYSSKYLYPLLLICCWLCIRSVTDEMSGIAKHYNHYFSAETGIMIIILFFLIFLLIISKAFKITQSKFISFLGALTYPIYLCHHNIGYVVLQRFDNKINKHLLLGLVLCAIVVLAYSIHSLIEKRFSKRLGQVIKNILFKLDSRPY